MDSLPELQSLADLSSLQQVCSTISPERLSAMAESALSVVIGTNFAGLEIDSSLPSSMSHELAMQQLSFGLNTPYSKMKSLPYLLVCKVCVIDRLESLKGLDRLLAFRILLLWQKVLAEPSSELKDLIVKATENTGDWKLSEDEWARYYLERADAHLVYYEYEQCSAAIERALECSGMNVELCGKMGKRTRFQQKALSQLVLSTESIVRAPAEPDTDVPQDCAMNDDTLLEKISLLDDSSPSSRLTSVQLAVILALGRLMRSSEHNDELLIEKCSAYYEAVISSRRCWAVQTAALLSRSCLEKNNKRRVERACQQSELICKLMAGVDDTSSPDTRLSRCSMVLACGLEPIWRAKIIHAEILRSLGCTSEALLIYEQMEMWDNVIDCYKSLKQMEKADSLIRRLLETRPNDSMLYVYLGDISQQASYYEKAIEISGDRNARARKSLGQLMLFRNHFEVAYEHLRRSLELQPIQLGVWFNAGHCAWRLERWAESASCYHRCVTLEPDHFEAWNNLSAAYIRQGQKERARRILLEALKFNYEHPKVWENYLLLCVDTCDFSQAIHSFHRLLDLNRRQEDDEVLGILANEILKMEKRESNDEEELAVVRKLKSDVIKLFARITASQTLSSRVWRLYAELKRPAVNSGLGASGDGSAERAEPISISDDVIMEFEKYIQLLEKAVAADTNTKDWSKESDSCLSTLNGALFLAEERLRLAGLRGAGEEPMKQAKSRIRMSLRPLLTVAQKSDAVQNDDVIQSIEDVKRMLEKVAA